ncbi:hypothetical protein SH1V18_11170 [Vallitalea longa]|uniref:Uncharacterized protein n=1 Tax=Vallitalea longa TaxID=2936439 RepID=A0A9W6DEN4_9FIRM|nr:hypothetical protein [Vallitalea longa]GKX28637.1 hypothetical protein SH1V18_11170 [Vallitalea longa]
MHTDDMIDIVTTIVILAIFIPITFKLAQPFYKGELGGFGIQIEKTALQTQGELLPNKITFTPDDVLLMLAVQDEYFPKPKVIEINDSDRTVGTVINIDDAFFINKGTALKSAFLALPSNKKTNMKIKLHVREYKEGYKDYNLRKWVINRE